MTFKQLWENGDEEARYLLDERAGLHEFDGELSRIEAEIRTVKEFKEEQNKNRWHQLRVDAGLI